MAHNFIGIPYLRITWNYTYLHMMQSIDNWVYRFLHVNTCEFYAQKLNSMCKYLKCRILCVEIRFYKYIHVELIKFYVWIHIEFYTYKILLLEFCWYENHHAQEGPWLAAMVDPMVEISAQIDEQMDRKKFAHTGWWKAWAWEAQNDMEAADREGLQRVEALGYQPSW